MSKRKYDRIIGILTFFDCSGAHYEKLGVTDMVAEEGKSIVYIDETGKLINTGEKVTTKDYDESNSDAIIVNNKYILIWI